MTDAPEYTLTSGAHSAVVSPFGASLRRYFVKTKTGEWNAVWGYAGTTQKKGGQGDVLIPFPGRIKGGAYSFDGVNHALVTNDKDGPNAIHGFVRSELFKTESVSDQHATFSYEIQAEKYPGFPFSLHIEVMYAIGALGLKTSYAIKNIGETLAPAGVGFHPYFCGEKDSLATWSVKIPAHDYIELENYVPTGRILPVEGSKLDFRKGRSIGDEPYNDCLTHLDRSADGIAYATLHATGSKNRVVISMDRSFDYVVIYTGDLIPAPYARHGFALEPMTCAPDAFNHKGWGTLEIKPGASVTGSYTIFAEVNDR